MSKKTKYPSERTWLNKEADQTAFVSWRVAQYDGHLKIGDCNRMVTLDFAVDNDGSVGPRSVAKLDRFLETVKRFRTALAKQAGVK